MARFANYTGGVLHASRVALAFCDGPILARNGYAAATSPIPPNAAIASVSNFRELNIESFVLADKNVGLLPECPLSPGDCRYKNSECPLLPSFVGLIIIRTALWRC